MADAKQVSGVPTSTGNASSKKTKAAKRKRDKQRRKRKRKSAQRAKERDAAALNEEQNPCSETPRGAEASSSIDSKKQKSSVECDPSKIYLTVCWLGAAFCGWQDQKADDLPSIGETLSNAMKQVTGNGKVVPAGRTDKGVHAVAQAIMGTFSRSSNKGDDTLQQLPARLNAKLPSSILRVVSAAAAPYGNWSPQQCSSKRYNYYFLEGFDTESVNNSSAVDWSRYCWCVDSHAHHPAPKARRKEKGEDKKGEDGFVCMLCQHPQRLDVDEMQQACALLVGEHDFRQLSSSKAHQNSVRCILSASVKVLSQENFPLVGTLDLSLLPVKARGHPPRLVCLSVQGSGFLRHMVRRIAGLLLRVGRGIETKDSVALALRPPPLGGGGEAEVFGRKRAPRAPACGLWLQEVRYDASAAHPGGVAVGVTSTGGVAKKVKAQRRRAQRKARKRRLSESKEEVQSKGAMQKRQRALVSACLRKAQPQTTNEQPTTSKPTNNKPETLKPITAKPANSASKSPDAAQSARLRAERARELAAKRRQSRMREQTQRDEARRAAIQALLRKTSE